MAATAGQLLQGDPNRPVEGISIDSRTVSRGDLFFAIRGERFDGHEFVTDALVKGATGAVVDEAPAVPQAGESQPAPLIIQVADTTRALQDVARDVRQRAGAKVVAITGSAGKTTTKEVAADFLSVRYRVFRNKGNLNNHIGLPLSLLELRTRPDVAVVELGMNHPGEIRTLVAIAEPEVRVWTNVGDAHLGFFDSAEAIADAKGEILEHAAHGAVLVANANDSRIMDRAGSFAGRVVTFGIDAGADIDATNVEHRGLEGMQADVSTPSGSARMTIPLLGVGNLANVLAAAAVALEFDVPLADIVRRAAQLRPAYHRGELLRLPGGVTLIDDSYNSSPAALTRALETVAAAAGSARKVAVLGEMLELGTHADRLHADSGCAAAGSGLDFLITVGGVAAQTLADAAVAAGMVRERVVYTPSKDEATTIALDRIRPGDLVLVKGSRGIGLDSLVERLKEAFA